MNEKKKVEISDRRIKESTKINEDKYRREKMAVTMLRIYSELIIEGFNSTEISTIAARLLINSSENKEDALDMATALKMTISSMSEEEWEDIDEEGRKW